MLSARMILSTTCSFPVILLLLPLERVEVSACSVFNSEVTNFSYLSSRHPLPVKVGG